MIPMTVSLPPSVPRPTPSAAPSPRSSTPRTRGRPTDGALGAFIAHLHHRPWKDHQRLTADVAGERLPTGRYRYPTVVWTFPRQSAKTTTVLDLALGRCLQMPDYRVAYAAQTGHKTTENFTTRFTELEDGPLGGRAIIRRSAGTERATLPGRSYVKAFPPKAGALRSDALDLVIVDEAQEHDEALGELLDQTIIPTFTTRPRRQLWIVGTAGTDRSAYFRRYLDQARAGEPGFALIDYGAPVEDPEGFLDPASWPTQHVGVATGLTDVDALAQALSVLGPSGFLREYGNLWQRTSIRVVDPGDYAAALLEPTAPRPAGRMCLGVDVAADRGSGSISIAVDGPTPYVEVIDAHAGTEWITGRALELQATHGAPIAIDRYGAVGTVADALELAGARLLPMKTQDVANAAAGLLDLIGRRTIHVSNPAPALTEAVDGLALRPLGDDNGYAFSRRASAAPIAPVVSAAAAVWGLARLPNPVRPQVHAG